MLLFSLLICNLSLTVHEKRPSWTALMVLISNIECKLNECIPKIEYIYTVQSTISKILAILERPSV